MIELDRVEYYVQVPGSQEYGPATPELLRQWAREGRIPHHAMIVTRDGRPGVVAWQHPEIGSILSAPPTVQGAVGSGDGGDATGGLIPYKNPKALIGYYTSIGSLVTMLVPFLGVIASGLAITLGVLGLKAVKAEPRVRGTAHAWVAIILGSLTLLASLAIAAGVIIAIANK